MTMQSTDDPTMNEDLNLLKKLLCIQSTSKNESAVVLFLTDYLKHIPGVTYQLDSHGNILVQKGSISPDQFYPCIGAHLDTVHHRLGQQVQIEESSDGALRAYLAGTRSQVGTGGDDKCGIYACLLLLRHLPQVKCAFFSSEEIGCLGSKSVEDDFFKDVGYFAEFDSPEDSVVTHYCMGVKLFDRKSEFGQAVENCFSPKTWASHPYTDVWPVRCRFKIACVNLPAGYYQYHSDREYVLPSVVHESARSAINLINQLGAKRYYA